VKGSRVWSPDEAFFFFVARVRLENFPGAFTDQLIHQCVLGSSRRGSELKITIPDCHGTKEPCDKHSKPNIPKKTRDNNRHVMLIRPRLNPVRV